MFWDGNQCAAFVRLRHLLWFELVVIHQLNTNEFSVAEFEQVKRQEQETVLQSLPGR